MLQPYRAILSRPGALTFSAAGVVARLSMSMVGIAVVLVVSNAYGSYGLAGRLMAAIVVAAAVSGPQIARLVDRYGQARVMWPAVALGSAGLVVLTVACSVHAHPAWLYAGAALAGCGGNVGALVRARWTYVLADAPTLLHTAYSLESALDEFVFVVGPVLATLLATGPVPVLGLVVPLVSTLVGATWFLAQRHTEPPLVPREAAARRAGSILRYPGLPLLVVVFVTMGGIFGANDPTTVAFATELGHKGSAGVVLAVFALGSLTGGLLYGARHWRSPLAARFVVGMVAMSLGCCAFLFIGALPPLAAAMFVVGLAISPTIVTGNGLVQAIVPPERLTEGLTWVGTAINVGVSVGASVAGARIDAAGAHGGWLVVAGLALFAVLVSLLAFPGLRSAGRRAAAPDEMPDEMATTAGV